jgi:drug/metabolite transporter (DMT)-like permease
METWIVDTLIAAILLTASYVTIKYAIIQNKKDDLLERVFILVSLTMGVLAVITLIFFPKTRNNIIKDFQNINVIKWIILSAICVFVSYFFLFRGTITAPNLGYARGILAIDLILLTLCSVLFFDAKISIMAIIGMLFIIFGIVFISIYN